MLGKKLDDRVEEFKATYRTGKHTNDTIDSIEVQCKY
jgi:hypothetical protein